MDANERTRCADALATATPETLREIADRAVLQGSQGASCSTRADLLALAALALAIAEAREAGDARIEKSPSFIDYLVIDIPMPTGHGMEYGACSLTDALAALVRGSA